jgi:hypothetical protein
MVLDPSTGAPVSKGPLTDLPKLPRNKKGEVFLKLYEQMPYQSSPIFSHPMESISYKS